MFYRSSYLQERKRKNEIKQRQTNKNYKENRIIYFELGHYTGIPHMLDPLLYVDFLATKRTQDMQHPELIILQLFIIVSIISNFPIK